MTSEELDNLFRNEVNGLDGLPPQVNWHKEQGWNKLNARLKQTENRQGLIPLWNLPKNATSWVYAIAATMSLTILSIVGVNHWVKQQNASFAAATTPMEKSSALAVNDDAIPQNPFLEKSINYDQPLNDDKLNNASGAPIVINDNNLLEQLHMANMGNVELPVSDFNAFFSPTGNNKDLLMNLISAIQIDTETPEYLPEHIINPNNFLGPVFDRKQPNSWSLVLNGNLGGNTRNVNVGVEANFVYNFTGKKEKKKQTIAFGIRNDFQFIYGNRAASRSHANVSTINGQNNSFGAAGLTTGADANINTVSNYNELDHAEKERNGLATFITASYSRNISKSNDKPFYLGLKAGYMVVNEGNSFDDNTLSLELMVGGNETSKFKVAPVVYLTDGMKNVVPGIKLGMALGKFEKDINI